MQLASKDEGRTDAATETKPEGAKGEREKSEIAEEKPNLEDTKPPARLPAKSQSLKSAQSNISNHGETNSNHSAMVTNPATSVQGSSHPATTSVHITAGAGNVDMSSSTTGHSYPGKPGDTNMVNSTNTSNVSWFQIPDAANCNMAADMLGENMMTDGTAANSTDSMDTDTSQLFAATYQVLEGEEDELLSANQHSFYDNKPQGSQSTSGTHMNQVHFQNSVANSQNQPAPHSMPATCSTGTTQNYISKPGPHPPHSSVPSVSSKASEPPKLAHHPGPPTNTLSHRPSQPSYPSMWPNQSRVQAPAHNRLQAVGNMAPYGSPVPPRSFPPNYPVRSEATQAKSFENQFSDFIRARHGNPFPPRGPNMQDPSRPQMQSPNSAQNFQSPNVTMNKFQNMNRYPFHQPLGPASGAIRDLACRVPTPQFPRGPPMMQGNMGHQPLQHQPSSGQPPYNQGPLPPQAQQQQQGYLGPTHGQWNQHHGNIPLNQHQMMSQRHSAQTPPQSQAQNFHPQQQQQLMQTAARNEGSPVPQIASPSLSQQAISNIPPIDPPALQHRNTPEKPSTPKKKKSSPKISRESTQESVKIQEEKALLENPHANVHIGHPKGKKCKFHRTKNSKDKYTVFGCRACNVALCKECHDEYHNELGESHQK